MEDLPLTPMKRNTSLHTNQGNYWFNVTFCSRYWLIVPGCEGLTHTRRRMVNASIHPENQQQFHSMIHLIGFSESESLAVHVLMKPRASQLALTIQVDWDEIDDICPSSWFWVGPTGIPPDLSPSLVVHVSQISLWLPRWLGCLPW